MARSLEALNRRIAQAPAMHKQSAITGDEQASAIIGKDGRSIAGIMLQAASCSVFHIDDIHAKVPAGHREPVVIYPLYRPRITADRFAIAGWPVIDHGNITTAERH